MSWVALTEPVTHEELLVRLRASLGAGVDVRVGGGGLAVPGAAGSVVAEPP